MARILIVDDDPEMCELLAARLGKKGFETAWRAGAEAAFELVVHEDFDVVLTDLHLRGMNGIELCERVVANRPDVPVIVLTAFGSLDTAVAAIRAGAYDFITKPPELEVLLIALARAVQHRVLRAEVRRLRERAAAGASSGADGAHELGQSAAMREVEGLIERVADSEATVMITGESGTGKELVARALHQRSRRRGGPFVAINCAAMPETLLESELFGHARGAFTDARAASPGLFLEARGGTLLLDEIGDMPLGLQPKLLRALQERVVRPVGGTVEVPFDARLLVATNRDLAAACEDGRFREDLYYRVNVIHIGLPPLRARGGDVLVLAQQFVQRFATAARRGVRGLSPAAAERLVAYAWPGNVRELANAMESAVALARFEEIAVEDLPERIRNYKRSHVLVTSDDPSELVPLEEVERRYILRVLEAVGGQRSAAARTLGMDRKTLYRKLDRWGVPPKDKD